MKMNIFFLIGGILSIILSVAHALWGEKEMAKELKKSDLSELTRAGFYVSYHQITAVLIINGAALVLISIFDTITGINIIGLFIVIITIGNVSVFLYISLTKHRDMFGQTIPQLILFTVMIVLILIGYLL